MSILSHRIIYQKIAYFRKNKLRNLLSPISEKKPLIGSRSLHTKIHDMNSRFNPTHLCIALPMIILINFPSHFLRYDSWSRYRKFFHLYYILPYLNFPRALIYALGYTSSTPYWGFHHPTLSSLTIGSLQ
jgi:hypothetical protein